MKYIKLYESFEDIDSICKKYSIENYTINSDGTVDVDGDVYLNNKSTKLPLKFGKVSGDFDCNFNNLTTLEGCPQSVGGNFGCTNNKLTTLEGCPQSVGGYFTCGYNLLISLKGCPQSVGGDFSCKRNLLTTLEGCPQSLIGNFYCDENELTTLKGGPKSVALDFYCNNNQLISLEGCPKTLGNIFNFYGNRLKDLYGFPEFFDGYIFYQLNPVSEILDLFNEKLVKGIEFLNEYSVIQQDGKVVILDRLEEVFHTLNVEIPEINLNNYEVY